MAALLANPGRDRPVPRARAVRSSAAAAGLAPRPGPGRLPGRPATRPVACRQGAPPAPPGSGAAASGAGQPDDPSAARRARRPHGHQPARQCRCRPVGSPSAPAVGRRGAAQAEAAPPRLGQDRSDRAAPGGPAAAAGRGGQRPWRLAPAPRGGRGAALRRPAARPAGAPGRLDQPAGLYRPAAAVPGFRQDRGGRRSASPWAVRCWPRCKAAAGRPACEPARRRPTSRRSRPASTRSPTS